MVQQTAMHDLFLGLFAALLPDPERSDFARRQGVDPAGASGLLGLAELFGGAALAFSNGLAHMRVIADRNAEHLLENVDPNQFDASARQAYFQSGPMLVIDWLAQPWTWLLILIPAVGLFRLVAYWGTRDAIGEPLVWAGLRVVQLAGRRLGKSRDLLRFGPERPDRIVPGPGNGLTVLSSRPKDWSPLVTIEIREKFYRLQKTEERLDGQWWVYAYELGEFPENEIIRALVRYGPPGVETPG